MDVREWLAEVAKAVAVKLLADVIAAGMRKASEPRSAGKHFADQEAK